MRTLIVGLGNPILGDDAIGWKVAELVEQQILRSQPAQYQEIDVVYLSIGGLGLMEQLIGYDRAIIIDAFTSGQESPGSISIHSLEEIEDLSVGHTSSVHDTSLQNSIHLASKMDAHVPAQIVIIGIETNLISDFSESLTPEVAAAIPRAVQAVIGQLY